MSKNDPNLNEKSHGECPNENNKFSSLILFDLKIFLIFLTKNIEKLKLEISPPIKEEEIKYDPLAEMKGEVTEMNSPAIDLPSLAKRDETVKISPFHKKLPCNN